MPTVAELQTDAQTYADEVGATMEGMINDIVALADVTVNEPPELTWAGHSFFDPITGHVETLLANFPQSLSLTDPNATLPGMGDVADIDPPAEIDVPEFTDPAPEISLPETPSLDIPDTPEQPGVDAVSLPEAPSYELPTLGNLAEATIPSPPSLDIPSFSATAPDTTLTAPTNTFAFAETPYASTLLSSIDETLLADITTGGYGIFTDDETQLVERSVEREREEGARAIDQAAVDFASRRFDLPPGALLETQMRARHAVLEAANTHNREVLLKRYDKFTEARQFALQHGISLQNIQMTYHGAMMERGLNAARYTAEAAISYFNAQVEAVKIRQAQYEVEARVYETRIRAEGVKLEQYRTQLEGQRLVGEINRVKIEAFRARSDAVRTLLDIYTTRMKGAEIHMNIERSKIEAYRARVDAFVAAVKAQEAKFSAFESGVRGQEARVKVFESQARAYSARLDGTKAKAEIERSKILAQAERAKAQIAKFEAEILGYKTDLEGQLAIQNLGAAEHRSNAELAAAKARAMESMVRAAIANFEANKDDFLGAMRHNLDKARLLFDIDNSNRSWSGDARAKGASLYAPLAAAALSAINTLGVLSSEG
jgi:hypothetical protein